MAFVGGYDLDDLTDRQYYYYCIMKERPLDWCSNIDIKKFVAWCVQNNYEKKKFTNYDGDCNWLIFESHYYNNKEVLLRIGIDVDKMYD